MHMSRQLCSSDHCRRITLFLIFWQHSNKFFFFHARACGSAVGCRGVGKSAAVHDHKIVILIIGKAARLIDAAPCTFGLLLDCRVDWHAPTPCILSLCDAFAHATAAANFAQRVSDAPAAVAPSL
eukprot:scaffold7820_cov15-Tisochrysis_lutea.AAC.1